MRTYHYEVMTNATYDGRPVWCGKHNGAYGYTICISLVDWARYTPIRFI